MESTGGFGAESHDQIYISEGPFRLSVENTLQDGTGRNLKLLSV